MKNVYYPLAGMNYIIDNLPQILKNKHPENKDEIILAQNIDEMCNDHYVLKLGNENIEVYHILGNKNDFELFQTTNISKEYLTNADIQNLENGIYVYGKGSLKSALEDFE